MKADTMTAWQILLERARQFRDPIAHACVTLVETGRANQNTAVDIALEHYANEVDRLKADMVRYLERHSQPMTVLTSPPPPDAAKR